MDGWARRLARSETRLYRRRDGWTPPPPDPLFDGMARVLATPLTRRRAVGVIGAGVLVGSLWRPSRSRAAVGGCTSEATATNPTCCWRVGSDQSKDRPCCVEPGHQCCSTNNCALACGHTWQDCVSPGRCDDTPRLCFDTTYPIQDNQKLKFCSIVATTHNGCLDAQEGQVVSGWCCRTGEVCGSEFGDCLCRSDVICGSHCCAKDEICVDPLLGDPYCEKLCPTGKPRCNGQCCGHTEVCGTLGCKCPSGTVECGGGACCPPREDPGDPNPFTNALRNMFNMAGESSAAHGGSHRLAVGRRAQTASPALNSALDALAAVNGQGAAAMLSFRNGKRDPAFRHRVAVKRAKPPTLSAGPGLDGASAAALNRLLAAEARANALIAASAAALWRARGARARHNRAATRSQLRASARFAGQAATALKRLPSLRTAAVNALRAGGVAEVFPTEDAVNAFFATTRRSGFPSYLGGPLGRLGVGRADLQRLRAAVLEHSTAPAVDAALLKPLADPDREKLRAQLVRELSAFSRRARRHRLAR